MAATTTANTTLTAAPDIRAARLSAALRSMSVMADGYPETDYVEFKAGDLWALFAVLAEEAERLYDEITAE